MYLFVLKNCLLGKEIEYFTDEKDCYIKQICSLGDKSNISDILTHFSEKEKALKFNNIEALQRVIDENSKKFAIETPCAAVVVNRKYDYSFIENTILILSFFQKYPAQLYCIIGEEDGVSAIEFYADHFFPHYKNIFPSTFFDYYKLFNKNIDRYKYILKLFLEANREKETGYKVAKYYTILEILSKNVNERYDLEKIKRYLAENQQNQPLKENEFHVNFTTYKHRLSQFFTSKTDFSYIELISAYRHLVVHYGDLNPPIIKVCFGSDQELLFLIQAVIEFIIKDIIVNSKEI